MYSKPVRVGLIVGKMIGGGVESVVEDLLKYTDSKRYVFDFIIDEDSTLVPEKKLKQLGANVIYVPPYQNIPLYLYALAKLFRQKKYVIVHANISAVNVLPMMVAKFCRVPVRIAHNHNLIAPDAGILKNLTKRVLSIFGTIFPNYMLAPTQKTGEWIFGKKEFEVIRNGIELSNFQYNLSSRISKRSSLGVNEEDFLFGSFGRLVSLKRVAMAVKIVHKLIAQGINAKLLIIGDGPAKTELKQYVKDHPVLTNRVIFLQGQNDIAQYYSALDAYLFPSSAEAFGIAAVESQANGLYTFVSGGVPDEAKLSSDLFVKINSTDLTKWLKEIKAKLPALNIGRLDNSVAIINKGQLSSKTMAESIQKFYDRAIENEKS